MPIPDPRDGEPRIDRRKVLRTGLAGAGAIAAGSLAGGGHVPAQEASGPDASPEGSAETPSGASGQDVAIGPGGAVLEGTPAPGPITVFVARKIVTMNPSNPEATHVAVRDGRILGAGSLEEVEGWGAYTLDETFQDQVLVPGMIDVRAHSMEGSTGVFPYVGYFDRPAPDGSILEGTPSLSAVIERLIELDGQMSGPDEPLVVVGFDPIYFPAPRLAATDLDAVSTSRPIFVFHANAHVATVNTAMLEQSGIGPQTEVIGVVKDADGNPTGELQEVPAMSLAASAFAVIFAAMSSDETIWNLGAMARNVGITTVGDLGGGMLLDPDSLRATGNRRQAGTAPSIIAVVNVAVILGGTRACRTSIADGAYLGRVRRALARPAGGGSDASARLPPAPGAGPRGVRPRR